MVTKRYHYIFDATNVDSHYISNINNSLENIILGLAALLNMQILHGPVSIIGTATNPGTTTFCVIDFSHISVHTFAESSAALIDIFSCKPFKAQFVREFLLQALELADDNVTYFEVKYPSKEGT